MAASSAGLVPTRRGVIAGLGALGGIAALPAGGAAAQPAATGARRIDVHHHFMTSDYAALLAEKTLLALPLRGWSPEKSLADMDRAGVATAMLSVTTPGVWFGDNEAARRLARSCNDYAARMVADHPGRFGQFGVLPLPDIDGSLREIAYVLDELKADGIGLYTSYGDKWLGDPAFAPIYEELNRRKAVVYTHPTTASCCGNLIPNVPAAVIEYGTDTTRAIANMLFNGAASRYHGMKVIFSHAGGTMPFLIERFVNLAKSPEIFAREGRAVTTSPLPDGVMPELRRFYYDVAQASNRASMRALKTVIPVSQIVFGTDFPYRTAEEHVKALAEGKVFSSEELRAIDRGNAVRLLPRLGA